jgi:hypothetical protein
MEKFDLLKNRIDNKPEPKPENKMIKRICSWCKADMGFKEGIEGDRDVTHGVCEKCATDMKAELESMKK